LYNNTTILGPHDKTLVQSDQHFCMILAHDQPLTKYLVPSEAAPPWHASSAELRPWLSSIEIHALTGVIPFIRVCYQPNKLFSSLQHNTMSYAMPKCF